MAPDVDFNFPDYIAKRYGEVAERIQSGVAYAYTGERRFRSTLHTAKPVLFGLTAATRGWMENSRPKLLATASRITQHSAAPLYKQLAKACETLGFAAPPAYLHEENELPLVACLGDTLDSALWVHASLQNQPEAVRLGALAWGCGEMQNDHAAFTTAQHYLKHDAGLAVKIPLGPASLILGRWRRRANITSDRAALLVCKDPAVALRAAALVTGHEDPGALAWESVSDTLKEKALLTRAKALDLFVRSAFYTSRIGDKSAGGLTSDFVDSEVASLLGAL